MPISPDPVDPDLRARIQASFDRQTIMATLGAKLTELDRGRAVLELPFRPDLCQQHGYVHAGALTTIVDSACGYAALSLLPVDRDVLTVDFTVNFLAPAAAERFRAEAAVLRSGRTLSVCRGEVFGLRTGEKARLVAAMQATIMAIDGS